MICKAVTTVEVPSAFWAKYGTLASPAVTTVFSPKYRSKTSVKDDFVVKDFKRRSSLGEVFNNPYSTLTREMKVSGSKTLSYTNIDGYHAEVVDDGKFLLDYFLGTAVRPATSFSNEESEARNAQLTAIGSVNQTDFDSLTFAGEWSKTKRLHRDLGNALLKVFVNPKRFISQSKARVMRTPIYDDKGNPVLNRKGKSVYKYLHHKTDDQRRAPLRRDVSDLYLVARYGVGPLLHDLEDACKHLCRSRALRKTARGSYSLASTGSLVTQIVGGGMPTETALVQHQRTVSKTVRYGLLYETSAFMSGAGSLGLTRPLSTAWELVPYSFVFDWFLNVGGWLDAIQPSGATKNLCTWESTRLITTDTVTVAGSGTTDRWNRSEGDRWTWSCNGQLTSTETTKSRHPWGASVPTFPALGSGFNTLRSFDFAALVLQKIR